MNILRQLRIAQVTRHIPREGCGFESPHPKWARGFFKLNLKGTL